MPERDLSANQLIAAKLVALGHNDSEVARRVGVVRRTVWGWRNDNKKFAEAVLENQRHFNKKLRKASPNMPSGADIEVPGVLEEEVGILFGDLMEDLRKDTYRLKHVSGLRIRLAQSEERRAAVERVLDRVLDLLLKIREARKNHPDAEVVHLRPHRRPFTCPLCDGKGDVQTFIVAGDESRFETETCHGCKGYGIVWQPGEEPEIEEEEEDE